MPWSGRGRRTIPTGVGEDIVRGANQGRVISVNINGPIAGPEASKWLVDSLADLINGNDTIVINGNSRQAAEIRGD